MRNLALLLFATACSPAPTAYSDVMPILEGRCTNCHYTGGVGGFALDSVEAATAVHAQITDAVVAERMPPWPAKGGPEYAYDWRLTPEQIETIRAWSEAGAPEGDPADAGIPLERIGSSLSRVDLSLEMPEAYIPSEASFDDYRCFPLPWTGQEDAFITGFNAVPGNSEIVHHIAAFLIPKDNLMGDAVFEQLQAWDDEEEGAGYSCFGGPSGPSGDLQLPIQQVAQWVPGNQGLDFPEGTGIEVTPGSWLVLQIHYNTATGSGADQTAIDFKLDATVEAHAAFAPWLNNLWPLGQMSIPPGAEGMDFVAEGDPRAFFEFLNPSMTLDDGFRIHSSMLHMHRLGASGEASVIRADGTVDPLVVIPEWDFDWQFSFQLAEPVDFKDGDQLSLTCTYDNNGPDAVETAWGEGSDDEMCVANLYISQL
jgi:hypothetical protein